MRQICLFASWLAAAACFTLGCTTRPPGEPVVNSDNAQTENGVHDHAHGSGPHGGAIAEWGGGKFHVEFTVDHGSHQATVYVLADDASTPAPIETDTLLLSIGEPRFQVELAAAPQDGESEHASSRFVGEHESLGIVQEFAGTISGQIDGTPYAGDFAEVADHGHRHEHP